MIITVGISCICYTLYFISVLKIYMKNKSHTKRENPRNTPRSDIENAQQNSCSMHLLFTKNSIQWKWDFIEQVTNINITNASILLIKQVKTILTMKHISIF